MFTKLRLSTPKSSSHINHLKYITTSTTTSTTAIISPPTKSPPLTTKLKHHNLKTYLSTTDQSRTDAVYRGTKYEYVIQSSLTRLGFTLSHTGGSHDHGIDLLGTWKLPLPFPSSSSTTHTTLKVLIQCKSSSTKQLPSVIRELEGAFVGAPVEWRGENGEVIAFLACKRPASKGVREAMARSRWPMGFVCCDEEGNALQMIWNRRAEEGGLGGVGVCVRYPGMEEGGGKVINLTWKGEPVEGA